MSLELLEKQRQRQKVNHRVGFQTPERFMEKLVLLGEREVGG